MTQSTLALQIVLVNPPGASAKDSGVQPLTGRTAGVRGAGPEDFDVDDCVQWRKQVWGGRCSIIRAAELGCEEGSAL